MGENKTDEGYMLMAEQMMRGFTKDIISALQLQPAGQQRVLERLREEAEDGVMSYLLDVAGLDFDDMVNQARAKLEGKGYGC